MNRCVYAREKLAELYLHIINKISCVLLPHRSMKEAKMSEFCSGRSEVLLLSAVTKCW